MYFKPCHCSLHFLLRNSEILLCFVLRIYTEGKTELYDTCANRKTFVQRSGISDYNLLIY